MTYSKTEIIRIFEQILCDWETGKILFWFGNKSEISEPIYWEMLCALWNRISQNIFEKSLGLRKKHLVHWKTVPSEFTSTYCCALQSTESELSNAHRVNFIAHFLDHVNRNENASFWVTLKADAKFSRFRLISSGNNVEISKKRFSALIVLAIFGKVQQFRFRT